MEACRQIRDPTALPRKGIPVPTEQEAGWKCNLRIMNFKQLQFHNYKKICAYFVFVGCRVSLAVILYCLHRLSCFFGSNIDMHIMLSP